MKNNRWEQYVTNPNRNTCKEFHEEEVIFFKKKKQKTETEIPC